MMNVKILRRRLQLLLLKRMSMTSTMMKRKKMNKRSQKMTPQL